ncbi:cyclase family protein [Siccirubricoccus phaeus]|uniref:cyclase family protein n=1 Tax=Siccirubricoccus phaeus TaxID=2595053 RepID=UPI0011F36FE1|nr:cyclase family protein [Siccirubricoccus phaeus]
MPAAHDHGPWGCACWGPQDELGAANLLTPEKRLAALKGIETGQVFDLSHAFGADAPYMAPNQPPFLMMLWATWRDSIRRRRKLGMTNDAGSNVERIEMTAHVGTHIDALGHVSKGDRLYNGFDAAETLGDWGLARLGVEKIPPLITRGLLFDVAGLDGGAHLAPGRVVTPAELEAAAEQAGFAVEPGDIALIRTGWERYFAADNARYLAGAPGIDVPAAEWLTRQGVVAIGADNMALEVLPNPDHHKALPVHQHCLAEAGVHIIENLALDEIAAAGVSRFCLIILPPKMRGATGAPVRPVALV